MALVVKKTDRLSHLQSVLVLDDKTIRGLFENSFEHMNYWLTIIIKVLIQGLPCKEYTGQVGSKKNQKFVVVQKLYDNFGLDELEKRIIWKYNTLTEI